MKANQNEIEVHFDKAGNTIVGSYSLYSKLNRAMANKNVFLPHGHSVRCSESDFSRLCEYVELFGNCIKSLAGFRKACELSGVGLV